MGTGVNFAAFAKFAPVLILPRAPRPREPIAHNSRPATSIGHASDSTAVHTPPAPRSVGHQLLETDSRHLQRLGANDDVAAGFAPEVTALRTDIPGFTGVGID